MSQPDVLPPDQRAVLSLLLRQGKTYSEVAGLLRMEEAGVRARAQAALTALGPRETRGLPPVDRELIADYLLGQQPAPKRTETVELLETSAPARAWARVVAGELAPFGADLPEIPADGEAPPRRTPARAERAPATETAVATEAGPATATEAAPATAERRARARPPGELRRSSRLGGVLLLGGLAALVAVIVIFVVNPGGSSKSSGTISGPRATATSGAPTSTSGAASTQVLARAAMAAVQRGSRAAGVAAVVAQGNVQAFAFQGQGLPQSQGKNFAYALWLANSKTKASAALGFLPPVGTDGKATAGEAVCPASPSGSQTPCFPANYRSYDLILLTQETSRHPTRPGAFVLAGSLVPGQ